MYWREGSHSRPHFHARYGEHKASFDFDGEIIVGELPRPQVRLVQAWTELHMRELNVQWRRAVIEQPLNPIPPLR